MGRHIDDWWDVFWTNWDNGNVKESVEEIMELTHLTRHHVITLLKKTGLMESNEKQLRKKYRMPERVPGCCKYARCPHCGRRMEIERIPFTRPELYDLYCYCGCRVPLPRRFRYNGGDNEG